jgi:hypothetical protein
LFSLARRLPFLLAAAIFAAAIGDWLVETISNGGVFGRGYDDNNHSSIVPALVAAAILAGVICVTRCIALLRKVAPSHAISNRDEKLGACRRTTATDIAVVLTMQFGALFTMESAEQLTDGGRLLGGLAWLGGPLAFSVATHAAIGTLCALLLAAVMRSMLSSFASFVREALEAILFALARSAKRPFVSRANAASPPRAQAPHVRQIGGRAPPARPVAA